MDSKVSKATQDKIKSMQPSELKTKLLNDLKVKKHHEVKKD